jgi:hypothetical protein
VSLGLEEIQERLPYFHTGHMNKDRPS